MRTTHKITSVALAAAMLFGLSGMASTAHAQTPSTGTTISAVANSAGVLPHHVPADAGGDTEQNAAESEVDAQATRQFTVTNMSGHTLKVGTVFGTEGWPYVKAAPTYPDDSWPISGTVLAPGAALTFEVHAWGVDHGLTVVLNDVATSDQVVVYMTVSTVLRYSDATSTFGPVLTNGGTVVIQDKPGTEFTIDAGQGQAQADVLNKICSQAAATCEFTATKQDRSDAEHDVLGPLHQRGYAIGNLTSLPQRSSFTESDRVELTNSIELSIGTRFSLSAKLMASVEKSIQLTFKTSLTLEHKFEKTEHIDISPGYVGWISVAQPVIRDTGDFTITMKGSNTKWTLKGVTFESPDPEGHGVLFKLERQMSAAEIAEAQRTGGRIKTIPDATNTSMIAGGSITATGLDLDGTTIPALATQGLVLDGIVIGA